MKTLKISNKLKEKETIINKCCKCNDQCSIYTILCPICKFYIVEKSIKKFN